MEFRVDQIDHVELTVPDRYQAAEWYGRVLGIRVIGEYEFWADDPNGPLMIGTAIGGTKLALFAGEPTGSRRSTGFHLVAFRVGSKQFMNFLGRLSELQLRDQHDQIVTSNSVKDHDRAFSIYFCDPYGHQLELTTYEHDETSAAIKEMD
jgi:catechol 2,3-dioxygenase-like lactoylglutathione lyase family enzyme